MGPSLIAGWRRRFASRGAMVAALLLAPVLFAAVAGIGIGPAGLGTGVGALIGGPSEQGPDEAGALASADDLGTGVAGLTTTPPATPADDGAGPAGAAPPGSTPPPSGGSPGGESPGGGAPTPDSPDPPSPQPPGDDEPQPPPPPDRGPVEELIDDVTRPVPDPPPDPGDDPSETLGGLVDDALDSVGLP